MQVSSIQEVAKKLGKSVSSIYSDLSRRPYALPPRIVVPGSRKVLFFDVDLWLEQHVVRATPPTKARVGRPTKAESLRKWGAK